MPELTNSHRRIEKATYAPISTRKRPEIKSAVAQASILEAMRPTDTELTSLARTRDFEASQPLQSALGIAHKLTAAQSPQARYAAVKDLSETDPQTVRALAQAIVDQRSVQLEDLETQLANLKDQLSAEQADEDSSLPPDTDQPERGAVLRRISDDGIDIRDGIVLGGGSRPDDTLSPIVADIVSRVDRRTAMARAQPSLEDVIKRGLDSTPNEIRALRAAAADRARLPAFYSTSPAERRIGHALADMRGALELGMTMLATFDEEMKVEPVGRLHLERIEMTPVGIQRGELVSSIPLAPKEVVNLIHREWSITDEQFETIISDSLEGFSERGVSEKVDMAQSMETERSRSTALNLAAAVSASGMGVTMSASSSYTSNSDESRSSEDSRNQSMESTRKASSRVRKDHKNTFRVASTTGTEDTAARTITNPSETESMRVDYFQMMRKWKVDGVDAPSHSGIAMCQTGFVGSQ